MKHSIVLKFLAILLTAVSLLGAVAGGAGIIAMESANLYVNGIEVLQELEYESIGRTIANSYATLFAVEEKGNLTYSMKQNLYQDPENRGDADHWYVQLMLENAVVAETGQKNALSHNATAKTYTVAPLYPIVSLYGPDDEPDETKPSDGSEPTQNTEGAGGENSSARASGPESRSSAYESVVAPGGYLYYDTDTRWENGRLVTYYMYYYEAPVYTVTVYLQEDVLDNSKLHILSEMYPYRYTFIAILVAGLLSFAIGSVYLCWSAGRHPDGTISPAGLNSLPLDLYGVIVGIGILLLLQLLNSMTSWIQNEGPHLGNLSLAAVNVLCIVLLGIAFLMALSAQIKAKDRYLWRHSVIGWFCRKVRRGIHFLCRGIGRLYSLLPLIWQWLLTAALMALSVLILFLLAINGPRFFGFLLFLDIVACIGIVLYGGYAFGTLISGAKKMRDGDLSHKISTRYLRGGFLDFANQLNALSEAALITAQKHMRSERMKSELITNVSHDIKTPLTSIINFVDLLQKPHTPEQEAAYLEVLARQSGQMKKLIEDLMELSKASSGNITVSTAKLDAVETVNQVLGEFSDKLEAAQLTPVVRAPQEPVSIEADGRLVWRVMSNLLSNAIKYALPGTRVYVDLVRVEDKVLLSVKNISREQLNTGAEELMERFVRGDASRNSEGSGLGLNIARSLMEVQRGQLQLLLDGDLFKVTLVFPAAD